MCACGRRKPTTTRKRPRATDHLAQSEHGLAIDEREHRRVEPEVKQFVLLAARRRHRHLRVSRPAASSNRQSNRQRQRIVKQQLRTTTKRTNLDIAADDDVESKLDHIAVDPAACSATQRNGMLTQPNEQRATNERTCRRRRRRTDAAASRPRRACVSATRHNAIDATRNARRRDRCTVDD